MSGVMGFLPSSHDGKRKSPSLLYGETRLHSSRYLITDAWSGTGLRLTSVFVSLK